MADVDLERLVTLRRIAELDPNDDVAQFGLGRACLDAKLWDEAERALARAVEINPGYSAAYRDLGRAQLELGRAREALDTLRRGIAVARERGDLQTVREMEIFSKRAERRLQKSP